MTRSVLAPFSTLLLASILGCSAGAPNAEVVASTEAAKGDYCHKKLQAVGPPVPTLTQASTGDITDYYGPCDGPSVSEQIEQQRRFESFRFGRDYMDEG